jgi:predicted ATPase
LQSAPPPPAPAPLLDLEPVLLERGPLLAELTEYLKQAAEMERGRLALVAGEAGIGKTLLVRRFCAEHGDGVRILTGACDSLPTPLALGPLVDVAG